MYNLRDFVKYSMTRQAHG